MILCDLSNSPTLVERLMLCNRAKLFLCTRCFCCYTSAVYNHFRKPSSFLVTRSGFRQTMPNSCNYSFINPCSELQTYILHLSLSLRTWDERGQAQSFRATVKSKP